MPHFHPVGFFLPLAVASFYGPRALPYLRTRTVGCLMLAGLTTYALPIWNPGGKVGVCIAPVYLVLMWEQVTGPRANPHRLWPEQLPVGVLLSYTFASVAIPDVLLTWEGGGAGWTVGGAGWEDGLLRFWLYLIPVFTISRAVFGYADASDRRLALTFAAGSSTSWPPGHQRSSRGPVRDPDRLTCTSQPLKMRPFSH